MKKHCTTGILISCILTGMLFSCTKASEDQQQRPPSGGNCDTVGMKYTSDVLPILQSNCYGCHGNGNTGGSGGISLDSYNNIAPYAMNGTLVGVITRASGYPAMPFGLPKLDDCSINKIVDWVNQGSPNN